VALRPKLIVLRESLNGRLPAAIPPQESLVAAATNHANSTAFSTYTIPAFGVKLDNSRRIPFPIHVRNDLIATCDPGILAGAVESALTVVHAATNDSYTKDGVCVGIHLVSPQAPGFDDYESTPTS
jgi:hypothetical protein